MVVRAGLPTAATSRLWKPFIRCLQSILSIWCWHKIRHAEVRSRGNIDSVEHHLAQRQPRRLGHFIRMQSNRLHRRLLYDELAQCHHPVCCIKLQYVDHITRTLNKYQVPLPHLEKAATDWSHWRHICESGLSVLNTATEEAAEQWHAHRHRVPKVTSEGPEWLQSVCLNLDPQSST